MKHIFFVHGFGVRKDARGMFPGIEKYFREQGENYKFYYLDLNDFSKDGKDTFLKPLSVQAKILGEHIDKHMSEEENIIIAHSQGCVVTALLQPENISKIIFLAPPTNNDIEKTIANFASREGTVIDKNGMSTLMRSDGNKTFVPAKYWEERTVYDYYDLYTNISQKYDLIVIQANQDELIENNSFEDIQGITIKNIDGNHNFEGESRNTLNKTIFSCL